MNNHHILQMLNQRFLISIKYIEDIYFLINNILNKINHVHTRIFKVETLAEKTIVPYVAT